MAKYAPDGSWLMSINDAQTSGLYTPDGRIRGNTSVGKGIYHTNGAYRVALDSPGRGFYDATGAMRVSTTAGSGTSSSSGGIRGNTAGGAAPPWTPASGSVGVPTLWFDASDVTTITHASGVISQVRDKAPNALHLAPQATRNPTYVANVKNGLGIIRFDGGDNLFRSAGVTPLVPNNVQTTFIVANGTGAGNNLYWTTNGSTVAGVVVLTNVTARYQGNSNNYANFAGVTAGFHVYSGYINLAIRELFMDGTSVASNAVAETSAVRPTQIWFGSDSNPIGFYIGDLGEFIQYEGALSAANRQQVEGYLAWKWGTQASLPAGHPYKSNAPTS